MMQKVRTQSIVKAVTAVLMGFKRGTVYEQVDLVVRATARFKPRANQRTTEMVLTVGKPNYRELEFIRACLDAGEKFPIRKTQLKAWSANKK